MVYNKRMKILMMGPPGVGKGTQAARVSAKLNIPHLSSGDMLRDHVARKTALGEQAKGKMDAGELVSDDIIIGMIIERVGRADCATGFLLDGFPRTAAQAAALREHNIGLDAVVDLDASDEVIVVRLSGRLVHSASGRTYHKIYSPPREEGRDDDTGEALIQRDDDKEETIRQRLSVYRSQTQPLQTYYREADASGELRYACLNGEDNIDRISAAVFETLQC